MAKRRCERRKKGGRNGVYSYRKKSDGKRAESVYVVCVSWGFRWRKKIIIGASISEWGSCPSVTPATVSPPVRVRRPGTVNYYAFRAPM